MAENKMDLKELTENELKTVTGGGSGYSPEGVSFSKYDKPQAGHYYVRMREAWKWEYIYLYEIEDKSAINPKCPYRYYFTNEEFVMDVTGNNWSSTFISRDMIMGTDEDFKAQYPGVLNVTPNDGR